MSAPSLLSQVLRSPRATGAIVSSSPALARAMVSVLPASPAFVVELGPGRGPLTDALLASGLSPSRLLTVESNHHFARALRHRLPQVKTVAADARYLPFILRDLNAPARVDAIVSSLPMRSLPPSTLESILDAVDQVLADQGCLVQFTYGATSPVPQTACERLDWVVEQVAMVWKNLPPARVYRYSRRTPMSR